jgi:predicted nucleotidyltransferase
MIAIDIPKEQLRDFCRRWKITEFSLFGSVTREDFRPQSDVDVLVAFEEGAPWSLFDLVDMRQELMTIFGREVDLLTRPGVQHSLNRFRREAILGSAVTLDVA